MKTTLIKKNSIILICILILAALLRFVSLDSNPPSLSWDEVAWGYNAYSLGIDGKDEFGRFLPIDFLESYGDFKPPLYAYLDILPVKILGLTDAAPRIPSAFFGVFTVLVTYFLSLRLFPRSLRKKEFALVAAFILAISPWHIMLSRGAFEANVALFFITTAGYFFLKGVQEKSWSIVVAAALFAASFYIFNTARIFSPLLVVLFILVFWRTLLRMRVKILVAIFVGIAMILPLIGFLLSPQASLRFKEVNIFSDTSIVTNSNQEITNDKNAVYGKLFHNRRLGYATEYAKHYMDHFNFSFLFLKGDENSRFSTMDVGVMYLWQFPALLIGALVLFRKREGEWWIIPTWILLAIVPAAVARETPHALRIENAIPFYQILTAYGLVHLWHSLKEKILSNKWTTTIKSIGGLIIVVSFIYFIWGLTVHYSRETSVDWQYGYKDSLKYAKENESKYDQVRFTGKLGRPYIYYLYYNRILPEDFRRDSTIRRDEFGFVYVERVGKYTFASPTINEAPFGDSNVLVIEDRKRVPDNVKILKKFNLLNGETILVGYTF